MMSQQFIWGVIERKYWLPEASSIKVRVCADPPSKLQVLKILDSLLEASIENNRSWDMALKKSVKRTKRRIKKYPPSTWWMILLISTINPDHEIFSKDYTKPRVVRNEVQESLSIQNIDGFFTGLPESRRASGKRIRVAGAKTAE